MNLSKLCRDRELPSNLVSHLTWKVVVCNDEPIENHHPLCSETWLDHDLLLSKISKYQFTLIWNIWNGFNTYFVQYWYTSTICVFPALSPTVNCRANTCRQNDLICCCSQHTVFESCFIYTPFNKYKPFMPSMLCHCLSHGI